MTDLSQIVADFASAIKAADAKRPQALNVRSKKPYQPGIGPHTETHTVAFMVQELRARHDVLYSDQIDLETPYPNSPRSKCDLCIGPSHNWEWSIEIKMMRFMGDNGKPNDDILMHILSPYSAHRSAVTDCVKLLESGLPGKKANGQQHNRINDAAEG